MTEDLYRIEIVLRDKPQDSRQHFRMRNSIFLTALHLLDMCRFQLNLSSIVSPRYKHELDLGTVMLSTIRFRGGKLRFGEKIKKNDFAPLKTNLTERPQATTAYYLKMRMRRVVIFVHGADHYIIRVSNEAEREREIEAQ